MSQNGGEADREMMSSFGGYDNPLFAELYDFTPPYNARPDIDFYVDLAGSTEGNILELGCGTGRILIPSAVSGSRVVGLDNSEFMMSKCREKLRCQPKNVQERVELVIGSMVGFELEETFVLITAPFRAFQHLITVEEQLSCLRCVNRHLQTGGKFVFDIFQVDPAKMNVEVLNEESEDFAEVRLPDGRQFKRCHRITAFHKAEQYNEVELIFYVAHPDGRTERQVQSFPFRYFFRYEVEHLLARTGFKVIQLFGNFDKSELTNDSPDMIFFAQKCDDTVRR